MVAIMVLIFVLPELAFSAEQESTGLVPGNAVGTTIIEKDGGEKINLGTYGKPYVLAFFVPGQDKDAKQLAALRELLNKDEFRKVVGMVITRGKDKNERGAARSFLKQNKFPFTLLFDPNVTAARKFGVKELPSIFIVDAKGILRTVTIDSITETMRKMPFADMLRNVIKGKDIPFVDLIPYQPDVKAGKPKAMIGKSAPDFSLKDLRNNSHRLSGYKGKNVLLVFWNPNCPHCQKELPKLQSLYIKNRYENNFEILAVTVPRGKDGVEQVREFGRTNVITFPILLDKTSSTVNLFGISGIPAVFFINGDGRIVEYLHGSTPYMERVYESIFNDPVRLGKNQGRK
jgi:peroxiredoxin